LAERYEMCGFCDRGRAIDQCVTITLNAHNHHWFDCYSGDWFCINQSL